MVLFTYNQARIYTELGWIIHPIRPPEQGNRNTGKAPFEGGWQHRTTPRTEEELTKFFRGTKYNIGLLCGNASGVLVVDIDDYNFMEVLTRGLDTSEWVMSARDNELYRGHLFFKFDPELAAQKHHVIGIEILSNGNNVVLPPSRHYSGGQYRWNPGGPGPDAVQEMPEKLKVRLLGLFKTEKKLKELLSKCRPCFRKFIETPEKLHGAEGRRFMLALATELMAAGQALKFGTQELNKCLKMAAKLVYREEYDRARTEKELSNVDPEKTWKCSTLSQNFPDTCECSQCKYKQTEQAPKDRGTEKRERVTLNIDMLEVAEALQRRVPIYYDKAGAFWLWQGNRYVMTDETGLSIAAKNTINLKGLTVQRTKAEFLEGCRITGRERGVQDREPTWVQFKDRVIDYRTGEEFTPTPEHFFTTPLPYNLGDSEETPQIDKLFEEWVGPHKKRLLYEILAYSLVDAYPIHRIFCLIGSGRNGKGQFMKLLRRFIGVNNITSTELERIEESRFETAKLFQKKAVFIGETSFNTLTKTNRLKQVSGGDVITGEWKRKSPFDFINTAKIIIATNSLPQTQDRTDGFYSRWLVIDFFNRFSEGQDVVDPIPDKEFENLGRKSLRILKELLETGGFFEEGTIEERARAYEEKSNPVMAFIKANCEQDPGFFAPLYELYDAFETFQIQNGYRIINKKQFGIQLQEMGFEKEKTTAGGSNMYYIQGLRLRKARGAGPGTQLHFNITEEAAPEILQSVSIYDAIQADKALAQDPQEGPQEAQAAHPLGPGYIALGYDPLEDIRPVLFQPIPGKEIPESATHADYLQDLDIIEAVRKYTDGTMLLKNLQMFIDHYTRRHPYIADRHAVGGRIRILRDNGWRPQRPPEGTWEDRS